MSDELNELVMKSIPDQGQASEIIGKLFTVTQPGVVFAEPVVAGEYTVITASEVSVTMGVGFGGGGSLKPQTGEADDADDGEPTELGGGGGGGGFSIGRPVAAISVGPTGVRVEPVVDVTKIGLAFITALGAMFMRLGKMRRASQR